MIVLVLGFTLDLLTAARLGDLFGRKRVFLARLAIFALAGVWSALASGPGELIAARAVQGAAAVLVPQVLSSLFVLFRRPERATVLGVFGVAAGLAQAGGLLLGGVLITADVADLGWRATFWVSVPAALILLALGVASLSAVFFGFAESDGYSAALTASGLAIIAAFVVAAAVSFGIPRRTEPVAG